MPDPRNTLDARVRSIAGPRVTVDTSDLITLARIGVEDTDQEIARKVADFKKRYPNSVTDPDDYLVGLGADARERSRRGLRKLGL